MESEWERFRVCELYSESAKKFARGMRWDEA